MRTLLVATGSPHKLAELRRLFGPLPFDLRTLADEGIVDEAPEEGATFAANAIAKARFYAAESGLFTLADDSGLEVEALGGAPGVSTRRYAGPNATDAENIEKLLAAPHLPRRDEVLHARDHHRDDHPGLRDAGEQARGHHTRDRLEEA